MLEGSSPQLVTRSARLVIQKYTCPRNCGWYRHYRDDQAYYDRIITHPLYGPVLQIDLVQRDIAEHNCTEYRNARLRLHRRQKEHEQQAT